MCLSHPHRKTSFIQQQCEITMFQDWRRVFFWGGGAGRQPGRRNLRRCQVTKWPPHSSGGEWKLIYPTSLGREITKYQGPKHQPEKIPFFLFCCLAEGKLLKPNTRYTYFGLYNYIVSWQAIRASQLAHKQFSISFCWIVLQTEALALCHV